MLKSYLYAALLSAISIMPFAAQGQLSTNPDKFLGNITTYGSVNGGGVEFASLWNQLTAENESKWGSIEGTRNSYNWTGCDNAYNYCKRHNIPFKFHCLVWGSQYPNWMNGLSSALQYQEIEEWMDAVKKRYPDLPLIDVVNEAIPGHAPAPFKDALGGDGVTGYDWIIKAFEMAHERWPDAILIYNDYNTFQWQKNEFINLVKILRDAGAPVDAYGCQSHDLTDMDFSSFKRAMEEIQNALQMPMYSTEYDIGTSDDQKQLTQYSNQIKYMWERPYVAGITLWGYIYGKTWTTDGNSGIIRNGKDRPAMTWLREYMATDEAKTAKSPYLGGVKEASVYIKPAKLRPTVLEPLEVQVNARLRTKTIDHIDFYVDGMLYTTLNQEPYTVEFTPEAIGHCDFKAIVYDTEGNTYQRLGGVDVYGERKPYGGQAISLPGVIEAENFDSGGEGLSFHDTDNKNEGGTKYRNDSGGVDIVTCNGGYAIGYTATGEWLEYTVDLEYTAKYEFDAVVSTGSDGSSFSISRIVNGTTTDLTGEISVPKDSWDRYTTIHGQLKRKLNKGKQTFRITITGSYVNIDRIEITCPSGINDILADENTTYEVYNIAGQYMGILKVDSETDISARLYELTHHSGIYLLRDTETGETEKAAAHP